MPHSWNKSRYHSPALSLRHSKRGSAASCPNQDSRSQTEEFQGNFATVLLGLVGFLTKVFPCLFSHIFILPSHFSEQLPPKHSEIMLVGIRTIFSGLVSLQHLYYRIHGLQIAVSDHVLHLKLKHSWYAFQSAWW